MNLSVVIVTLAAIIGIVAVVAILARIQQSDAASRAVPRDPMGIAARSRDVVNGSIGMYLLRRFTGRRPDPPAPPPLPPLSQTELEQRLGIGTWPVTAAPSTIVVSGEALPVAAAMTPEQQPVFAPPFVLQPAPMRAQPAVLPTPTVYPARVPMPMATPVPVTAGPVVQRRPLGRLAFNIALVFLVVAAAAFAGFKVIPEVNGNRTPASPDQLAVIGPPTPEPTPSPTPAVTPTPDPTATPTAEPTASPSPSPSAEPSPSPSPVPTAVPVPTAKPTARPTAVPTNSPAPTPTKKPKPTPKPTPVPAPFANLTCPTQEPTADLTCSTAGSQHVAQYIWDFGDGSSSGGPMHHYSSPGCYVVKLTVKNSAGVVDTDSQSVSIEGVPCG